MKLTKLITIAFAIILPTITIFSVLFYLFWAGPLTIVLQEYDLNNLGLRNYPILFTSVIVCLIYMILLSIAYFKFPKIYSIFIGTTLFLLLGVFAYSTILPYSYGGVVDNITLIPSQSLLGFSKMYYLFDILLLGALAYLAFIIVKYKSTIPIFIFIFIFYNINNSIVFYNAVQKRIPDAEKKIDETLITLSSTEKNILLVTLDGFSIGTVEYFLTNQQIEPKFTDWSKNFTFYDNVINLGGGTMSSMPNMYGGEKFHPAQQFTDMYYNKLFDSKNIDYCVYREYALSNFQADIKDYAQISRPIIADPLIKTPFLAATLYKHTPYFLRHLFANNYAWKLNITNPWFNKQYKISVITNPTSKSRIGIVFDGLTHVPWGSKDSPITLDQAKTIDDLDIIFKHNTRDAFVYITDLINQLKELGIYDNTKIIINSDHGTHTYVKTDLVVSYRDEKKLNIKTPVFMVKDFNSRSDKMSKDNRFLALTDTRGIIENAVGKNDLPDYTKILPPKRVFNILGVPMDSLVRPNHKPSQQRLRDYIKNNTLHVYKVTNQNPYGVLESITMDLTNIKTISLYKIIED